MIFQMYTLFGDGNVVRGVEPYPIDEDFLEVYDNLKRFAGDDVFYLFQKETESPGQTYFPRGCVLKYYPNRQECTILKVDWQSLVLAVSALRELYNLIEDYCGYGLPMYYP